MAGGAVRIGLLGCSSVAEHRVLPALARSDRLRLVAVASRSPERAAAVARRFGGEPCDYGAVLDAPLDAVYVSLPPALHHGWGRRVLEAGKHLLLDKPFTASLAEAEDLVCAARERGLRAMEALMYVHHPWYRWLRELVEEGRLGPLRRIDAWFGFPHRADDDHRYDRALGGGATLDALVYPLSFCLGLLDDPGLRWWSVVEHDPERGIDVRGSLLLSDGRVAASIGYGFGMAYRNEIRLWGATGDVAVSRAFSRPPDLAADVPVVVDGTTTLVKVPAADHFELMLDAFARKVQGTDRSGVNEGEEVLRRMRVLTDVRTQYLQEEGHGC